MPTRSELRAQVIERSGGECEWNGCFLQGRELAHLRSIGMGGRKSADTLSNVAWLCQRHARASDGEYRSFVEYQADLRMLGITDEPASAGLAFKVAEMLSNGISARSGWVS